MTNLVAQWRATKLDAQEQLARITHLVVRELDQLEKECGQHLHPRVQEVYDELQVTAGDFYLVAEGLNADIVTKVSGARWRRFDHHFYGTLSQLMELTGQLAVIGHHAMKDAIVRVLAVSAMRK